MKDHPIPFSAPMIDALIAGRKIQTRRLAWLTPRDPTSLKIADSYQRPSPWQNVEPGDRLWVRESYFQIGHWEPVEGAVTRKAGRQKWRFVADSSEIRFDAPAAFRKGRHTADPATSCWHQRLGRFMPRRLSRLTLIVTAVKIERLQDISEADVIAEGLYPEQMPGGVIWHSGAYDREGEITALSAKTCFNRLWDHIHGADVWPENPEVVAISFKVIRANIDAPEARAA